MGIEFWRVLSTMSGGEDFRAAVGVLGFLTALAGGGWFSARKLPSTAVALRSPAACFGVADVEIVSAYSMVRSRV